ncbi:SARP family transcriptional regulator [Amycolatopsis sp. NBRC 101858]|uniref:AfsR/SARP family transcriptional regulator n=1 Tax=Amycolatopsis sp. NBRC 101858 TaxID=3032200 RepID=UPI0024A5664B|nr:BTAD domain-containing putative transcriptional regulator [Amycolatopsis sp. NBRC 101858]GLY43052.1 SARP family transcriptional regulator [Amycolatopsis sp. NBRC 101858]
MLEFGVLGPLRVLRDGVPVPVNGPKVRALLAVLALRANAIVSFDRLTELLWGDDPPETARKSIQVHTVRLRRVLGDGVVETRPTGYLLHARPERHDLLRFRRLLADARAEPAPEAERALLADALACWRGPLLADLPAEILGRVEAGPAEERLWAQERFFEVSLELGRHAEVTAELGRLAGEHPWQEAFWALYLEALHGSGRRADALEVYRTVHRRFADELGIDPGERLRHAHQAVLAGEPAAARARFRPRQLPPDVGALAGRATLMSTLDAVLGPDRPAATHPPIALLVGPAGVGKTTAAVHWAHRAARHFPDGQLFVDLQGSSTLPALAGIEVLTRFSHALGVRPGHVPTELADAAALYRSVLAERRVLIVLDNVAGPDQVRALLPGSPGCAVLITSRDRLGGLTATVDTRRVELAELPPEDSLALLAAVVGPDRVHAEEDAARELVRLCAGLPLALRIVAANLALWPDRSLRGYLAELAGPDLVTRLAVPGAEQLGVRRAFDLSFDAVSPAAAGFFRLLGLVPGADIDVPSAAALAGADDVRAGALLRELAASHLVQSRGDDRFGLHDLLRGYAIARARDGLPEADRAAALDRLLEHYLRTGARAAAALYPDLQLLSGSPGGTEAAEPAEARRWLLAEHANLLAAIRSATGPFAWQAADLLRGFFHSHRLDAEWQAAATAGLAAARRAGDERAAGAMRHSLGALAWSRGDYPAALTELEAAQASYRVAGARDGADSVLHALGVVHLDLGRLDRAVEHFTAALAGARRHGTPIRAANGLINLGAVLMEHGELAEGIRHNEQALELCRRLGSPHAAAIAQCNLGYGYRVSGDLPRALAALTEALDALRELGSRDDEADALVRLAAVHRVTGDVARAWPAVRLAVTVAREAGNQRFEVDALSALGDLHRQTGDAAAALADYGEAHALAEKICYLRGELTTAIGMSSVDITAADAESALRTAEEGGFRLLAEQARTTLATTALTGGHPERAETEAARALDGFRQAGHRLGEAWALLVLGSARAVTTGPEAARKCWREAEKLLAAAGAAPALAEARRLLSGSRKP